MGSSQGNSFDQSKKCIKFNNSKENKESDEIHDGYIIDYKAFIEYEENKKVDKFVCYSQKKIKLTPEIADIDNLINKINQFKKYIIIDQNLFKKICDQRKNDPNTHKMKYRVTPENIILFRGIEEIKFINNNDNIIQYPSSLNINRIYIDILNYFEIEKNISEKLKNNTKEKYNGILIDNTWINNWKKYSNYDSIKKEDLENINKDKIENILMKNFKEKLANYDYFKKNINDFILDTQAELNSKKNEKKSYVIITKKFLKSFTDDNIQQITFILSNQNIEVEMPSKQNLKFRTENNIISINNSTTIITINNKQKETKVNNISYLDYLKHLIRLVYLKKKLFSERNTPNKKFITGYLINNKIIESLNDKLKIKEINSLISKNNIFSSITYDNFNEHFNNIFEFLNSNHQDYIRKNEIEGLNNFTENDKILIPKIIQNQQNLKFIDKIQLIGEDFQIFLKDNYGDSIILPKIFFAIKNNLILLIIEFNQEFIYEIASFNENFDLTVEYLIEIINHNFKSENDNKKLKKNLLDIFNNKEISDLVSSDSSIKLEYNFKLHPIDNNLRNSINEISNKSSRENTLIIKKKNENLTCFVQEKSNKLDSSVRMDEKNLYQTNYPFSNNKTIKNIESLNQNCYIMNKKLYEFISEQSEIKVTIKNNNKINSDSNKYQINFGNIEINGKILNFPINFEIKEKTQVDIDINVLKYYMKNNLIEEIDLIKDTKEFYYLFTPKNNNFNNNKNNLLYLYLKQEEEAKELFKPIAIIECNNNNFTERNNIFNTIYQIKKEEIIQNPQILKLNLKYTCYLIEKNKNIGENLINFLPNPVIKSNSINHITNTPEDDENNMDYFLKFTIKFVKKRNRLIKYLSQKNIDGKKTKTEYYLINKKYINELNNIFKLKNIKSIIDNNPEKNNEELLNIIKKKLPEKDEIIGLNKNIIQQKMDSEEISKISIHYAKNIESTKLCFYKDFEIITKEIFILLEEIDKNIKNKCIKVNCIFDENKIIININEKIINIANYIENKNNNEENICVEYIIKSKDKDLLFNHLEQNGYKYIQSYLIYNNINIPIINNGKNKNISAEIYKITPDGEIIFEINDKLKVLLLTAISQNYVRDSKIHNVYLINPQWLNQFNYENIKTLVNENFANIKCHDIKFNDLKDISNLIRYLDKEKLKKINDELLNSKQNLSYQFESYIQKFLIQDKYILFSQIFIPIDQQLLAHFQNHFGITQTSVNNISFIHKKDEGDLIIMKKYPINIQQNLKKEENIILCGKYDLIQNKYSTKYILYYDETNILESELQYIINYSVKDYIKKRAYSIQSNYISPLIENDKLLGNVYKFKEGFDYSDCINYYNYLNNRQLLNAIYLYSNDSYLKMKIKQNHYYTNDDQFYLIKKKFYTELKIENNYDELKSYLEVKFRNIIPNMMEKCDIIKNIADNDFKLLNNLNNQNHKNQIYNNVDTEQIKNPINESEIFFIYNDFELIEKNCAIYLLKDINTIPYITLLCSFFEKYIMFHYFPNDELKNKYYFCVISSLDEKNNYKTEYIIKYKNNESYKYHFEKIKKCDLDEYLKSFNFVKGVAPIVRSGYIELGEIIKIKGKIIIPLPPIPHNPFTRQNFPSKPLIGLENIGATCYMNATLQCFCNCEKFVDFFKYNKYLYSIIEKDPEDEKLCSSFKLLIENLCPNEDTYKKKSYAPEEFKDKISKLNPLFEGIQANDAKDLVNFLIMTLHSELNKVDPNQNLDDNNQNIFNDQSNKELMFTNFANNFMQTNKSIISDLFYALNYNCTQCSNCKVISYNYQIYFFLIFPLEEVRKFKLMNNSNNLFNNFNIMNNNNVVDIMECFEYDRKMNIMSGDNAMYCNYCKQTCNSYMRTFLSTGPEILIILLNRGKGIQFDVKINFYLNLDLSNYIEMGNTGCQYELYGVITHIGESGMGGHFIAYCKEYWTGKWLKFNDAIVTPVNDFKTEVIDFAMPYLLFYQKKNNN